MSELATNRRAHGLQRVGPLGPLEPPERSGLREVRWFRAVVAGHAARISVARPALADGAEPPRPSLALALEPRFEPLEGPPRELPPLAFEWNGSTLRAQIRFHPGTSLYGGGQAAGRLLRNGRALHLWNTDAWRYGEETPALYQSQPFVHALRADGAALGILADSARRGLLLFADDGLELAFEAEPFDLYLIEAAHPLGVCEALSALVGRPARPPRWALGYHQSRWSYGSQDEVLAIARELRARRIPCDALWLDIDHMEGRRSFTFDRARFPDPRAMTEALRAQGLRTVAIVDPGLAADPSYGPCAGGLAGGHFVRDARGEPVRARVWPGPCHFPDFTREATRAWWARLVEDFVRCHGLDGIWIDMNEPAVFGTPTKTLPEDARHEGLGGGAHARFHNLYGQLMAQATREGLLRARPRERPFVLTRSAHLATARFAATWTGDNQATWDDLRWAIPMVLSLALCGQPLSGPDLGGFDGDPSPELYARWFDLGAWLPFARGHAERSSRRKEPWAFGSEVEACVRGALERRMRLVPYLAARFEEAARTGRPVARPLFCADPLDLSLREIDDQFLLGGDLLVAPVVEPGATGRAVRLPRTPGGGWYAFPGGGRLLPERTVYAHAPPGQTPVFARAGSVVVLGPPVLQAGSAPAPSADGWEIHAFLDSSGRAEGDLREDGGPDAVLRVEPGRSLAVEGAVPWHSARGFRHHASGETVEEPRLRPARGAPGA